jgi:4-amino-4-deoxy-L-arabinose transferase-like glycosyltransferase
MNQKEKLLVILLFFIAIILRFYRLGSVPVGFHRDEAFLGYNAYSLLRTGRDMSGNFLPLHFESFIYSPGGYSYFTIPGIILFG